MFVLPDLPYAYEALEPAVSAKTLRFHHDKHHKAYVDKTNALAKKAGLQDLALEDVVREARRRNDTSLFNNAAQAWNHDVFWRSMSPARRPPAGDLAAEIERAFQGLDRLKKAFVEEGANHFASGWVWLVAGDGALKVISTHDADDVLVRDGLCPLLVCDLWEHAYYLDYQNDRPAFLNRWFDEAANWAFAESQFDASRGRGPAYRYPALVAA